MTTTNSYQVIDDPKYGYARVDPIPTDEEVERYYQEEFYATTYQAFNDSAQVVQDEQRDFNRMRYHDVLDIASSILGGMTGRSVFDIGCGFGEFLKFASEQGLHCAGMEVSTEAVDHVKGLGFDVFLSEIQTDFSMVGDTRFNLVTLFNVLEHVREPVKVLTDIRTHLIDPKGVLAVDVPNEFNLFQTVANDEYDLEQWWVAPPAHINYFSPTSLKRTLEHSGYEVVDTVASFPLELFLLMGDVYVHDQEKGRACHDRRVQFEHTLRKHGKTAELVEFYRLLARANLGRQVTCYARPRA